MDGGPMIERTLVLLKPDAVQRGLMGEIISRFEKVGLKIIGAKLVWIDREQSKKHYNAHVGKKFYKVLEDYIVQGPVLALVLEGVQAVENVRKMAGPTEPLKAAPGTIRGDFAHISMAHADTTNKSIANLIHASGTVDEAQKEIALWFKDNELHSYKTAHEEHVF
ncbi:MAG TPA: nucleoside-diphosphate kinase [Candidatus Nanoarchaeia archaeon]|nr:nucleoside-diphosphate kinase [Candidatus Nanoarchaeia archaeon]